MKYPVPTNTRWAAVATLCLSFALPAAADQDMLRFGLTPGRARDGVSFATKYTTYEDTDTDDPADNTLGISRLDTHVTFPHSITLRHTRFNIYTRALLPNSGLALPDSLERATVALSGYRKLDNNLLVGGRIGVSSASDRLFHSPKEISLAGVVFLRKPTTGQNAWLFMLSGSVGSKNSIMPGIAYQWKKSKTLWGIVGPPFLLVHWEPREKWSVDARVILLEYSVAAAYRVNDRTRLALKASSQDTSFYRADRADNDDSITYSEHTAKLELTHRTPSNVRLIAGAGYAFEREIGEDDDDDNSLDIDPGWFGAARITVSF